MALTQNKSMLAWIDEMTELMKPDQIVWIDGSEEQLEALRKEACESGEMIKLNEEKLPGCYLHRTKPNDVARVEARTFICANSKEEAGPTNNWMEPAEAYKMLYDIARGRYAGRTICWEPRVWACRNSCRIYPGSADRIHTSSHRRDSRPWEPAPAAVPDTVPAAPAVADPSGKGSARSCRRRSAPYPCP